MTESERCKRMEELEAENRLLRAENRRLREALGLPLDNITAEESLTEPITLNEKEEIQTTIPFINKYSAPEEKITHRQPPCLIREHQPVELRQFGREHHAA